MLRYYVEIAPVILPHLHDRPITLIRFPDGVKGESFYEKNAPKHAPDWIETFAVARREHEGSINYILINNTETLAWCANLGAIELHPFLHRVPALDRPTHVAFDLDPGEGSNILSCAEVAFLLRDLFGKLGLESFPKVSGSKGLQLYVPLNTAVTYAATTPFAKTVAELLTQEHPQLVVSAMAKALRKGRVMIDWSQNVAAKTTVSVYSMRGKRDEPFISAPITWKELEKAHRAQKPESLYFTPDQVLARVKKLGDLFAPVLKLKQRLPKAFLELAPQKDSGGSLARYAAKRDFSKTAEPPAKTPARQPKADSKIRRFVIQKHAASHLHFDFRLEMGGTLKSWAVPKGLPYEVGIKRSAFEVEDHPLAYFDFEGTIPKGQYGGGTVMVWDTGTYELLGGDILAGDLKLRLSGKKLQGEWHLFRIRSEETKPVWLIIKAKPSMVPLSEKQENTSVLTRRSMEEIARQNTAQWHSDRPPTGATAPQPSRSKRLSARKTTPSPPTGPKPEFVEPMKPQLVSSLPEGEDWMYEIKWDGYRAQLVKHGTEIRLLSRNENSLAEDFPAVIEAAEGLAASSCLIDGEVVALDPQGRPLFQELQNRATTRAAIVFYAFDLLFLDGKDLRGVPLRERRARLAPLIEKSELRLSDELPGTTVEIINAVGQLGLEGVVAKRRESAYSSGHRSSDWQKVRIRRGQEFVIGGYRPGMKPFESILVGYYEGEKLMFAGKVRPGFTPRTRQQVWSIIKPHEIEACPFANLPNRDKKGRWGEGITAAEMKTLHWVKPTCVVQIEFVEWTDKGGLRHASYQGLRPDKKPADVQRETPASG